MIAPQDLNDILMQVEMNKEGQINCILTRVEPSGKRVRINPKALTEDEKKLVTAKFTAMLHKLADRWTYILDNE